MYAQERQRQGNRYGAAAAFASSSSRSYSCVSLPERICGERHGCVSPCINRGWNIALIPLFYVATFALVVRSFIFNVIGLLMLQLSGYS